MRVVAVACIAGGLAIGGGSVPVAAQSKAAQKSVDSVNAVIRETEKGRGHVEAALESLRALGATGADLPKAYRRFSKSVAAMSKTKDKVVSRVEDMNDRREAYLRAWQDAIKGANNPQIKSHMVERKKEIERILESSKPAREAARNAVLPFLSNLQDIDKLLSLDLSPAGVRAAEPITKSAVANGKSVLDGLDSFLQALEGIRDRISSKGK